MSHHYPSYRIRVLGCLVLENVSEGVLIPRLFCECLDRGFFCGLEKIPSGSEMERLEAGSQPEHSDMVG